MNLINNLNIDRLHYVIDTNPTTEQVGKTSAQMYTLLGLVDIIDQLDADKIIILTNFSHQHRDFKLLFGEFLSEYGFDPIASNYTTTKYEKFSLYYFTFENVHYKIMGMSDYIVMPMWQDRYSKTPEMLPDFLRQYIPLQKSSNFELFNLWNLPWATLTPHLVHTISTKIIQNIPLLSK